MNERDIELAAEAEAYADYNFKGEPYWREAYESRLIDLIRADERKQLEAELLKLKDGIAASSDYIQGRWDLIGEFQDAIRARGNT